MARLTLHIHTFKEMFDAVVGQHFGVKQVHCSVNGGSASQSFVKTTHGVFDFLLVLVGRNLHDTRAYVAHVKQKKRSFGYIGKELQIFT